MTNSHEIITWLSSNANAAAVEWFFGPTGGDDYRVRVTIYGDDNRGAARVKKNKVALMRSSCVRIEVCVKEKDDSKLSNTVAEHRSPPRTGSGNTRRPHSTNGPV